MGKERVKVSIKGRCDTYASVGDMLANALGMDMPCGGHGRCGKCRVIASGGLSPITSEEERILTDDEIRRGVRLACCARITGDCEAEAEYCGDRARIVTEGMVSGFSADPIFQGYCIALDIGTTTLAASLFDDRGRIISVSSRLNPQGQYGADVISRIEAAIGDRSEELSHLVRGTICEMICEMTEKSGIASGSISGCVICGNTAMMALLLGGDVSGLSVAPFEPSDRYGRYISAEWLSGYVASGCRIYAAPCVSGFVGGDAICSTIAATGGELSEDTLIIDIGTNGEAVLLHDGRVFVCSTAAGPAFEGVGISCGMRAADGAIDKVGILNGEVYPMSIIGGGKARGICGSGLIDAMAVLLELGEADESGELYSRVELGDGVYIDQADVRMLQVAKSAIRSGIEVLCHAGRIKVEKLCRVYIAGGFGKYLDPSSAVKIGLFPREFVNVAKFIGNGALAGAYMLGMSKGLLRRASEIADGAVHVELSTSEEFSREFIARMQFPAVED